MKNRSPRVLLEQMLDAARTALSFVSCVGKDEFLNDPLRQHAVSMAVVTIGEMASRLVSKFPAFVAESPDVPWSKIQAMRNRIAHGYYELNFGIVWDTVTTDVPELVYRLPKLIAALPPGNTGDKPTPS